MASDCKENMSEWVEGFIGRRKGYINIIFEYHVGCWKADWIDKRGKWRAGSRDHLDVDGEGHYSLAETLNALKEVIEKKDCDRKLMDAFNNTLGPIKVPEVE